MLADDKPLLEASQWFKGEIGKVENREILDLKPSNMDLRKWQTRDFSESLRINFFSLTEHSSL